MSESVKTLKKPRRVSLGKIILFLILFLVISIALSITLYLFLAKGFNDFTLAMEYLFNKLEIGSVWDFIYKWGSKLIGLFK